MPPKAAYTMEKAKLCYDVGGETHCKNISIPLKRYGFGIYKYHEYEHKGKMVGNVRLVGFVENPKVRGYGADNMIEKNYIVPFGADNVRLIIGKKVISKAK